MDQKGAIFSSSTPSKGDNAISYNWFSVAVLLLLCIQNAGHALMTRYSRGILKENYDSTEVVICSEITKLIISTILFLNETDLKDISNNSNNNSNNTTIQNNKSCTKKLFALIFSSMNILVLVVIYAINNLLIYFALGRIDTATFTVIAQLKILTTAIFSVVILGKTIDSTRWRALILLVIACILVASPRYDCEEQRRILGIEDSELGNDKVYHFRETTIGLGAVVLMTIITGFAAVYFESILKSKQSYASLSIWARNVQLAFFSCVLLFAYLGLNRMQTLDDEPYVPFKGWTINTVLILLFQSGGGILVALALKYTDAVLKVLATSGAIVLSSLLDSFFFKTTLGNGTILGAMSAIIAIFNYSFAENK